ncbi:translation initiation factor IF-2 [Desulfatibacillum aliphaticivorans]|uniref:translation initiation factor IF-2 n=1 Tax=Desulfatibacillum aliphaticivorans TaxID=218208 RepID=UPI000426E808|nr:translation initiation factor IF-2 [Desulfatibacillum aliphaticivorans]
MAKLRVHELARELNMTNKVLLDKLQAMDLPTPVRSHMSSLDDDVVALVKASLVRPKAKSVVEKRIGTTVIRRRKKVVKPAEGGPEETAKPEEGAEEGVQEMDAAQESVSAPEAEKAPEPVAEKAPEPQKAAPAAEEPKAEEGAPAPEKAAPVQAKEEPEEAPQAEAKPAPPKKVDVTPPGDKAKIIAKPEPPQPAEPEPPKEEPAPVELPEEKQAVSAKAADTPAEPQEEPEAKPEIKAEAKAEEEAPEKPAEEPKAKEEQKAAPEDSKEEPKAEEPAQPAEDEKAEEKAKAPEEKEPAKSQEPQAAKEPSKEAPKPKGKKKKKKETAAKIISLPTRPVEPVVPPASRQKPAPQSPAGPGGPGGPGGPPQPRAPQDLGGDPAAKKEKRKKKGRRDGGTTEETDSKFFKKKISFRKKAVVEGADLYDKTPGKLRKGKKGGKAQPVRQQKTQTTTPKAIKRRIKIDEAIAVADLAKRLGIKAAELIKNLMGMGIMATVNQMLDYDTAVLLAAEFGYEVEKANFEEETVLKAEEDAPETLSNRPPVVTIMGHVDHGKTSLLDAIRESNVTGGEAGGITQHIGAYLVDSPRGRIAFLDTPGHEAFTAMRARGAQVTDIVILVVAADDGVMPQTVEAVNHSKAAGVPIIVAVNKMDKEGADPDRVMRELSDHGLVPEDWGGDTIFVQVSAKQRQGLDDLLEMVLLQAEVLELQANPDKLARGHVVEAKVDPGRGPVATVLIQEGTLHAGDVVVCGIHYGKVRAMYNEKRQPLDAAGPACPAEILGLSGVPMAGDEIIAVDDEKVAKQVSSHRAQKQRATELAKSSKLSLDNLFDQMQAGNVKDLNLIIKADVQGSIEALRESLEKLSGDEVKIHVVHAATGTVLESDVALAAVSNAIIVAFNVRPSPKVSDMAAEEHVDIRFYDIIYNAINEIKDAIVGLMESTYKEHVSGRAEVRDTFTIPKVGTIAGCYVTDGKVERHNQVRLLRDGVVIFDGKLSSLRRFKDDVKEVATGYECGMGIENFNDIKIGDVLELYYLEEIKPVLK